MAKRTSGSFPVARSGEPRSRTALLLESIALRHQIAALERSRTRRPCFRLWDRLFWILFSRRELTRPLAAKNVQLVTERGVLEFHNRPATESAYKPRNDRSLERKHAGDVKPVILKTLDFSLISEFSVGTAGV